MSNAETVFTALVAAFLMTLLIIVALWSCLHLDMCIR